MENLLTDIIKSQIGSAFAEKAGKAAKLDSNTSESLINAALPFFMGALAKNSADPKGASNLDSALAKDHDGSVFDHLDELISDPAKAQAPGILKHLFGDNQSQVEEILAKEAGTKPEEAGGILQMLAPVVMGALGKAKNEQGLGATEIANLIGVSAKGMSADMTSIPMASIMKFLDADQDGKVMDDLFAAGGRFLKKRFLGR